MIPYFSSEQITFFRDFLRNRSGYLLNEHKEYLLKSRLKIVLDVHKLAEPKDIIAAIKKNPICDIAIDTIEAMTVNETFFFRDDKPFEFFREKIIPELAEISKIRPVKIWSAACSTGQEPYSIAFELEESRNRYPKLKYEIDASDINNRILAKARYGSYSNMEISRGLPETYRKKYFTQMEDYWRINKEIGSKIRFIQNNLIDTTWTLKGPYDVIFLRNVLIYFDRELKKQIIQKAAKIMRPDAYLILGVSENIYDATDEITREVSMSGIYRKK